MKREILFRGFHPDENGKTIITIDGKKINGEWVISESVHFEDDGKCQFLFGNRTVRIPYDILPETVCQFTGLTDKNGNKIFEGDIVKYSDEECYYPEEYTEFVGEIVFESGAFGIGSREELPIDLDYWCDNDNFVSLWELYWNFNCTQNELPMLEVIGNIYEKENGV